MYREIGTTGLSDKFLSPPRGDFSVPWRNSTFINAHMRIRNHLFFVDTYNPAKTFTARAGAKRIIVIEQARFRLDKGQAVEFKPVIEISWFAAFRFHDTFAFCFIEGGLNTVCDPFSEIFILRKWEAVDYHTKLTFIKFMSLAFDSRFIVLQKILNTMY